MFKKKTMKSLLMLGMILFGFGGASCANNQISEEKNTEDTSNSTQIYYMNVIDLSSSMTFDYMNPNCGFISLHSSSSHVYNFNGRQTYNLISIFDTIPLNDAVSSESSEYEDFMIKIFNGIDVEVSYKYINSNTEKNDATVHFYILVDGTLFFMDHRKSMLFYSNPDVVDYNGFKNRIIQLSDPAI